MPKMVKTDTQKLMGDLFQHCLTTYQHSLRVGDELFRFASYLHLEDVETIYVLGILHDIGKLGIPHALLNKQSPLNPKEYKQIQLHTEFGQRIIEGQTHLPRNYSTIVKLHHENFDGTGYSRMIRVIDTYDTMLYGRIYQTSKTQKDVIRELQTLSGTQFDPEIVTDFLSFLGLRYSLQTQYGT